MIDDAQFASLLLSVFLIGVLGAGHCASMCGGFVSAFVLGKAKGEKSVRPLHWLVTYNAGRIISYAIAGAGVGALGSASLFLLDIEIARSLARLMAALCLIAVGLYLSGWPRLLMPLEKIGHHLWARVSPYFVHFLRVQNSFDALRLGLCWGWLPCGLVYSALISALTTADPLMGAQVMIFFGLGTLPALLTLGLFARGLNQFVKHRLLRRSCGAVIVLLGAYTLMISHHH